MPIINNTQDPSSPLFVTRNGRLLTNYDLDLATGHAYSIDNTPILSLTELGVTVTRSNLKSVGTLHGLEVEGDTLLGGFAFFNSTYNRIGIGTDGPSAAIDILENNVQTIIGSPRTDISYIGTHSNHDLAIVTDNQERVLVKNNGDVVVNGDLHIAGTLTVTSIVSDTRANRSQSLIFFPDQNASIFGLGLAWVGEDRTRQLTMGSGDILKSTESFDIGVDKEYSIGGKTVLTSTALGSSIVSSNLTKIGTLETLDVTGVINTSRISFNNLSVNNNGIGAERLAKIVVDNADVFYGDRYQVVLGDISKQTNPVKVFGPLSVNINNPDPSVEFSVNGDVNLGGKKFTNDIAAPVEGTWHIGDICWNKNPQPNSYVGWICIVSGSPGQWTSFGRIASPI
jgi:hypothetical protein